MANKTQVLNFSIQMKLAQEMMKNMLFLERMNNYENES
jgi:hypothetical protein